jgi:shikimate dehydrogenase
MMHLAALQSLQFVGKYEVLNLSGKMLPKILASLWKRGFLGLNVTNPHKIAVIEHLTGLSQEAKTVGSVNTLIPDDKGFRGDNTDALGFQDAYLDDGAPAPEDTKALVLGAGGVSQAVIVALQRSGYKPLLTARDPAKAEVVADRFGLRTTSWERLGQSGPFNLLVNATTASTPAEFNGKPPLVPLKDGAMVIDVNYARQGNHFKVLSDNAEGTYQNGQAMLAHQAHRSFKIWTGHDVNISVFHDSLVAGLLLLNKAKNQRGWGPKGLGSKGAGG